MSFDIKHEERDGAIIIELFGKLDSSVSAQCKEQLNALEDKLNYALVIFNLRELEFISSVGWGIFLNFADTVKRSNGELILTDMNDNLDRLYILMGIRNVIKSFRTAEEALAKNI